MARTTIRRALKALARENEIVAVPRHGYRVVARANDPGKGCPLAYVLSDPRLPSKWDAPHQVLLAALQDVVGHKDWSLFSLYSRGTPPQEMLDRLIANRIAGVLLDAADPEFNRLIKQAGIPAVMLDSWEESAGLDTILQDGHQGGMSAVQYLAGRGHRTITWFGPVEETAHRLSRFGGVAAGCLSAGLDLSRLVRVEASGAEALQKARDMLSRPDRPRAVLALWSNLAVAMARAAAEQGLVPGKDLDLVGWTVEELFESQYAPSFSGWAVPPTIVWSAASMAEIAVTRLMERRERPDAPVMKIEMPVSLRLPDGWNAPANT
jgi:LacI family transcriptional regulator